MILIRFLRTQNDIPETYKSNRHLSFGDIMASWGSSELGGCWGHLGWPLDLLEGPVTFGGLRGSVVSLEGRLVSPWGRLSVLGGL
jgi:hypothetical protein